MRKTHNGEMRSNSLYLSLISRIIVVPNCLFEFLFLQMGLKYGCPVEDIITGLSIQCLGWKSVYLNPARKAFLGVAPTTMGQTLVQHKRWSEGDLQILLSKYSPAWYGLGRISPGLILGYCTYCLWPLNSLATLSYCIVPSLYLLLGIPLFPQVNSFHFLHMLLSPPLIKEKKTKTKKQQDLCGNPELGKNMS